MRFNLKDGPCKDIRVRKAISHALDRKALIAGVDFGLGRPASCMYPSDHWCHNPILKPVTYDPELSKKLLAQAGYKNGLTIKGYMGNTAQATTLAEAIKAMLAKVGITWKVELLDPAAISGKTAESSIMISPAAAGPGSMIRISWPPVFTIRMGVLISAGATIKRPSH